MPASLYTHVIRYCGWEEDGSLCRGHREPRPSEPPVWVGTGLPPKLRRKPKPMAALVRIEHYLNQNELDGRNDLTVRQQRQVRRMALRGLGKSVAS